MAELKTAFDTAPVELEVGFTVVNSIGDDNTVGGVIWNEERLFHVLADARYSDSFFVNVSRSDVELTATIYSSLKKHDNRLIDIKHLAGQLSQLKALPHKSPLRFLGYFAILESLLTHAPMPTDPYDSITRQVKKKVALLNRRWDKALDYTPFDDAPPGDHLVQDVYLSQFGSPRWHD